MRGWMRLSAFVVAIMSANEVSLSKAWALDLAVDTPGDSADPAFQVCDVNPVNCTLRGAILRTNALPGPHTISLEGVTYQLGLIGSNEDAGATGDLDIAQSVTIVGAGAGSTFIRGIVSATSSNRDRVFHVLPTGSLTLTDVTVENGLAPGGGGGILASGPLMLQRVHLRDNRSTFADGGGLYIQSSTTIRESTLSGNRAEGSGGGAVIDASTPIAVLIANSTVVANVASLPPIGIPVLGGGIALHGSAAGSSTTIQSVTVANNSGQTQSQLYRSDTASLVIRNSLVVGTCTGISGNSQGFNLESGTTCGFTGPGDIQNTDPLLGPLQDNGGPTLTRALGSGSAAIDRGNPLSPGSGGLSCEAMDQRGLTRSLDSDGDGVGRCDIGAVEGAALWFPVDTTTDSNSAGFQVCDSNISNNNCSLRGAISKVNGLGAGEYVITLPATGAGNPYRITQSGASEDANATGDFDIGAAGEPDIRLMIVGGGATTTIVDGNGLDRVFHQTNATNGRLTLQDLTVQNGNRLGIDQGGGILSQFRPLTLLRVRLRANTAISGGGLQLGRGGGVIADSTISDNVVSGASTVGAGAIYHATSFMVPSTLLITNSTISGNRVTGAHQGGALYQESQGSAPVTWTFNNVTLANNSSAGSEGGILAKGTVNLRNSLIANNTAPTNPNCGGTGTFSSQDFNLVNGGGTCGFVSGNDIQNQNPALLPLANYGGPTETLALGGGSAAIDRGSTLTPGSSSAACAGADQRGVARPVDGDAQGGARCDIGAYEAPPCTTRANVALAVGPAGSNTINVNITAGVGTISRVRGIPAKSSNIAVDVNGQVNLPPSFDINPGNPPALGMALHRANVGLGSGTLAFIVTDGCGDWETFAGGGPSAWPAGGSAAASAASTAPTSVTPTPSATPVTTIVPGAACATFVSHAEAQAYLRKDPTDPLLLDTNRNGVACEGSDGAGFVNPPLDHVPVPRP